MLYLFLASIHSHAKTGTMSKHRRCSPRGWWEPRSSTAPRFVTTPVTTYDRLKPRAFIDRSQVILNEYFNFYRTLYSHMKYCLYKVVYNVFQTNFPFAMLLCRYV